MTGRIAQGWQVFGATARGASHVRTGLPNQDAIGWLPPGAGERAAALAVSDGHGGKRYVKSHIGSRLAVEAALAEATGLLWQEAPGIDGLAARIHQRWMARVNETRQAGARDHLLEHGATMLVAAVDGERLCLCQIGDGDILVGHRSGTLIRPLAEDILDGEQTHSLCEEDAPAHARAAVLPIRGDDPVEFVMLSTDGLAKSFAEDAAFLALARHYRSHVAERGLATLVAELPGWLSAASASGSGDDISLGFLVAPDIAAVPLPVPEQAPASPAEPPPPAPAPPLPRAGGLPPIGWLALGALLMAGVAVGNPWRPWPILAPVSKAAPDKPVPDVAAKEAAAPEKPVETPLPPPKP